MKNAVFWDVTQCRSCVKRRFGGTYRLHLQGRKISERGTSVSHGATSQKTALFKFFIVYVPSQQQLEGQLQKQQRVDIISTA
jgi:hypothetical protein